METIKTGIETYKTVKVKVERLCLLPGGHPSNHYRSQVLLNFGDLLGSGASNSLWSQPRKTELKAALTLLDIFLCCPVTRTMKLVVMITTKSTVTLHYSHGCISVFSSNQNQGIGGNHYHNIDSHFSLLSQIYFCVLE